MAGKGSRFADAGYKIPKPLIKFNGKMMIEHVLDSFISLEEEIKFVLIVREDFLTEWSAEIDHLRSSYNITFVVAKKITQGASCSVLLARDLFKDTSLLVADSDTFYEPVVISEFLKFIKSTKAEQSLITFKSQKNCYSYIAINNGNVLIAEKRVISEHAISGIYFFKYSKDFTDAAIEALIYGEKDHGEYYMSKVFWLASKLRGNFVNFYEISSKELFCTGTPEQLKEVLERLNKN